MRHLSNRSIVAAVLGALAFPALAADRGSTARQDCSVCDDPTWPELRDPAPPIEVGSRTGGEPAVALGDPTWPELRDPAPAVVDRPRADGELASVQGDPTWPAMATAAPAFQLKARSPEPQVASLKAAERGAASGQGPSSKAPAPAR